MATPAQATTSGDIFDQVAAQPVSTATKATGGDIFDQVAAGSGQGTKPGPTLAPNLSAANIPTFGESWQSPEQRLTMPLVKGLVGLHDKLREIENFTPEGRQAHPIQAAVGDLANRIEGLLVGTSHGEAAIGTGEYGMATNPVTAGLLPGAEGEPAAAAAIRGGANLVKSGYQAVKGAVSGGEEGPGLVKQILKGKEVAQEPAQAAIRSATGGEGPMLEGNKTVMDDTLAGIKKKADAAYKQADTEAGFDIKELRAKMQNDQYKLKQLGNTPEDQSAAARLQASIADAQGRLSSVEGASENLQSADALHKQFKAGQEFRAALVRATSADGETVNVDGLLNASKKLRTISKRGDRLAQFFGSTEKADEFMTKLQAAQDLGNHAMKVQKIAQWLGGLAGAGTAVGVGRELIPGR